MLRLAVCLALTFLLAAPSHATDFHVFNTNDSGAGSLRQSLVEALADQGADQQIWFHASYPLDASIVLLTPLPALSGKDRIAFLGNARNPRIVAPVGHADGIMRADASLKRLRIDGLRFDGGRHAEGGACVRGNHDNVGLPAILQIANSEFIDCQVLADGMQAVNGGAVMWNAPSGEVAIVDTVFRDNAVGNGANGTAYGSGGALWINGARLVIERSRFYGNRVQATRGSGGVIATGIHLVDTTISDSVFSDNAVLSDIANEASGGAVSASCFEDCAIGMERNYFGGNRGSHGGALFLRRANASAVEIAVTLANNTFHDNVASTFGGALYLGKASFDLAFNTLEGNRAASGAHLYLLNGRAGHVSHNVFGSATGLPCYFYTLSTSTLSGGHNVFVNHECLSRLQPGTPAVPTLGAFGLDLDGPVPVLAFAANSPVTDAGAACLDEDARRTQRPLDGDGDGVALCDIGAYERPAAPPLLILADGFED